MTKVVSLIVAAADNGVIGANNQLPWHLPKDLAYFKKVTTGNSIIMGRKTYESIGKALPNRQNIVITRQTGYQLSDAEVVYDLNHAIELAQSDEIFIIGGAEIFQQTLAFADRLYLNRIKADFEGDTFLPKINWTEWQEISKESAKADDKNEFAIDFLVYERKK